MTPYHVVRAVESDPIKTLGVSRSIHLIDLAYGYPSAPPYPEALIGGIQCRSGGLLQLWGRKEGSATVYVSDQFSPSLIPATPGADQNGILRGGGYLLFDATFDQASSYAVQSLGVYKPDFTQLAFINFVGSPAVASQMQQVEPSFLLFFTSMGGRDYTSFPPTALWG